MTAGIDWEEETSYFSQENDATAVESRDDWVAYLLEKEMSVEQGTLFDYNSTSSQALSEILTTATGVPTNEYAERHLFGPIGITEYFGTQRQRVISTLAGTLPHRPRSGEVRTPVFARRQVGRGTSGTPGLGSSFCNILGARVC